MGTSFLKVRRCCLQETIENFRAVETSLHLDKVGVFLLRHS